jgi:hypothetical protein
MEHDVCGICEYKLLVNQELAGPIVPERGLSQGDSLSPYLFILCAQGLMTLINKVRRSGVISMEFEFAGRAFVFTNLLFVDDCFLFCRATDREVNVLKNILSIYEDVLGQQINFQKFKVLFSKNGWEDEKANIAS